MGLIATITGDDLQLIEEVTASGIIEVDSDSNGENDVPWNDQDVEVTVQVDYSDAFAAFADAFYSYAFELVPVDTGHLQSTISASSDDWSMTAEASADYAQYVEFGTYKMDAQPYFVPALNYAWGETADAFQQAVLDAMDEAEARLAAMGATEGGAENGGFGMGFGGFLGMLLGAIFVGLMHVLGDMLSGGTQISYGGGGSPSVGGGGGDFDSLVEII